MNHELIYMHTYTSYTYTMQSKYITCWPNKDLYLLYLYLLKNKRKKWKCPFHLNLQDGVQHIIQAPPIVAADQWGRRWPSPLCSRWNHQVIIGLVLLSSASSMSFWSYLGVIIVIINCLVKILTSSLPQDPGHEKGKVGLPQIFHDANEWWCWSW